MKTAAAVALSVLLAPTLAFANGATLPEAIVRRLGQEGYTGIRNLSVFRSGPYQFNFRAIAVQEGIQPGIVRGIFLGRVGGLFHSWRGEIAQYQFLTRQ